MQRREELERRSRSAVVTAAQENIQHGGPGAKMGDLGLWHTYDMKTIESKLATDVKNGLTEAQYKEITSREDWKPNSLTPPPTMAWYWKFFEHLTGLFSLLLWVAALLCFIAVLIDPGQIEYLYLGIVLAIVVFLTGIFSYYQDAKADEVLKGFANMLPPQIVVVRDGQPKEGPAASLTVGDVVNLKSGNQIPADCRVVQSKNLSVDNSSLTGENLPQKRNPEICHSSNPLEATNLLFYGTSLMEGSCTAVVVRTGDHTAMGHIAQLVRDTEQVPTPISIEIHHFIKIVTYVAVFLGVTFVIIGFIKGIPFVDNLVFGIGIIVANVPEGLLATVTLSLTLTSKRMHLKKVLVKNLEAVETLGSTTVIASDKTGTLTQNRMTVVNLYYNNEFSIADKNIVDLADPTFHALLNSLTLCTTAYFHKEADNMALPIDKRTTEGDATETAMIKFAEKIWQHTESKSVIQKREQSPELFQIPFSSKNKFAANICKMDDSGLARVFMKGAPERILQRCNLVMMKGKAVEKTDELEKTILDNIRTLMLRGQRVLACCEADFKQGERDLFYDPDAEEGKQTNFPFTPGSGLTFVGLAALQDPPRPAVPNSVLQCKSAHIQVIMVTGDHPDTAEAIAREVFIVRGLTARKLCENEGGSVDDLHKYKDRPEITAVVCTGAELSELSNKELDRLLDKNEIVFARTSPAQKLRIVQALQTKKVRRRLGEPDQRIRNVVAVTGDGVNDSPALKAADIGIAMGEVGSQVAKDSADMILIDDNFASLIKGVEEGRLIFDNLKKSIAYTLSSNIPEISPFLLFILVQIPLPLPTVLILCIDLGTDMVPAISLAYENKEANIMNKPPRDMNTDRLVTTKLVVFSYLQIGIIQAVAGFYSYFVVLNDYGFDPSILMWLAPGFTSANLRPMGAGDYTHLRYEGVNYALKECNIDNEICHDPEEALAHAQCAFFISIIVVQWADLVCCKTRELSLMTQGMRNGWLNFGLLWETGLGALLCYTTPLNLPLGTRPIHILHWIPAMPFAACILAYDETRKYLMRNLEPGNWLWKNTYY